MNVLYGLGLALQFLTRFPVPIQIPWTRQSSKWAIRCYPLVGIILGFVLALLTYYLTPYVDRTILTFLLLSVWVWLTGGLHLDGWMDVADAVGSNAPLEKKWEIMEDSHVGSFAIIALLFLLGWKAIMIYTLLRTDYLFSSFLFILAFSRLGAVVLMLMVPTAKKQGLAFEWRKYLNKADLLYAVVPMLLLSILFKEFLYLIVAYVVFFILFGYWLKRSFKGTNGDLLGTAIEGGELWGLVITWMYISFVMG